MSTTSPPPTGPQENAMQASPLGVGNLITETFSIFVSRFWLFAIVGIVVMVIFSLLTFAFFGGAFVSGTNLASTTSVAVATVAGTILSLVGTSLLMGILALAAYDAKLNKPARLGTYIAMTVASLVPLVVLSIVNAFAMMIGLLLLVVPGIFILVIWSVMAPAVVIERAGFSGLGRSAALTKGYRWPVLGFLIILFIINVGIAIVLSIVAGLGIVGLGAPSGWFGYAIQGLTNGLSTAIYAIGIVVLFARLKELKEGVGMDDLAEVFA